MPFFTEAGMVMLAVPSLVLTVPTQVPSADPPDSTRYTHNVDEIDEAAVLHEVETALPAVTGELSAGALMAKAATFATVTATGDEIDQCPPVARLSRPTTRKYIVRVVVGAIIPAADPGIT